MVFRTRTGRPLSVVTFPIADHQLSQHRLVDGPSNGFPTVEESNQRDKRGTAVMKDRVPSIGSNTQTNSASSRTLPYSSPMIPWSGNRLSIRSLDLLRAAIRGVTGNHPI